MTYSRLVLHPFQMLITCIQDKEDDKIVGVKSTALRFGDSTKKWVSGFGIACISGLALSGCNANIGNTLLAILNLNSMKITEFDLTHTLLKMFDHLP